MILIISFVLLTFAEPKTPKIPGQDACVPCLLKMEETWRKPDYVWINIDKTPGEVAKSLQWLKKKEIGVTAYFDHSQNIRSQVGGPYPLPMEMRVKNLKVEDIAVGWKVSAEKAFVNGLTN